MTKFIMGLLLGLILGIGGTAAFLISAGGGDYLVVTSPRVRELEASLKQGDQEREWLRGQLRDSSQMLVKLESRFIGLATRFEDLGSHTATLLGAPPTTATDTAAGTAADATTDTATAASATSDTTATAAAALEPTGEPEPTATPVDSASPEPTETATATATPTGEHAENDSGEHDANAESPGDW